MIVIGSMNLTGTKEKGVFNCPNCQGRENYRWKTSRPFLTLYFIPVLPIGGLQEYIVCGKCKQSFETEVLSLTGPSAAGSPSTPVPFETDLLRCICLIMVDDGQVSEKEISVASSIYEKMTHSRLTREDLGRSCSEVMAMRLTTLSYLNVCCHRVDHNSKLLLVQAMFAVASADGQISPGRLSTLMQAQSILSITQSEFELAISSSSDWIS